MATEDKETGIRSRSSTTPANTEMGGRGFGNDHARAIIDFFF